MTDKKDNRPLTYRIAGWHGFCFAGVFLLYGGVTIILDILDRNYDNLTQPIMFAILGLILISVVFAYKEGKRWGWYGLVIINCLIVVGCLFGMRHYENIILFVLSVVALYTLFASPTKDYLFGHR
ncbi:MAG: hypothetical protein JSV52_05600 [Candidatus Zixiibacteriota bacterium]|nr:MAG: hypothetical protein JSV52_05600 [candidate division Zixibacteria bacterium]